MFVTPQILPKKVFSLDEVRPGERSHQICVVLKDVPGALAKAAKVLADANMNSKTGSTFYVAEYPNAGIWSSFVDVSKATRSIERVKKELRKLDVVLDVIFWEPKPAPFESVHFPVLHGTTRAMIMPIGMFRALWNGFERILAPSGLAAVIYDAGKRMGRHAATRLKEMFGLEGKDLILAMAQAGQATGWSLTKVKRVNFKQLSAIIIVENSFEAAAWRKKPYNACHWTRGYLAGYMSTVFKEPVEAVEVKCMAKGDKHCKFKIQKQI
jgi:predicted hydrocarbon binding protein